jgi:CHAT domain-containing protein/tetratricopeptide (TPR) repeat protein
LTHISLLLTVSITDIDGHLAAAQMSLSLLHRSHPKYITLLDILAMGRLIRYKPSHQKEDLDKPILHYTEAIFLSPMSRAGPSLNAVQTLCHLTKALLMRSEEFKQPEGIKSSIEYLRHLRRFPLDSFDPLRIDITTSLIRALRSQIRLGAGNGTRDINEMLVLCIDLLSSRQSAAILAVAFSNLREAAEIELDRGFTTEMIDQVIECLRGAVKAYPPDSYDAWHQVAFALAYTLHLRFTKTHSKKDWEVADALLEKILEPGGCPDSFRDEASTLSVLLAFGRSAVFQEPEYSEVAIPRLRAYFGSASLPEELRLTIASAIASESTFRFREFSLDESLEEANSYISQLVNSLSSSSSTESAEGFWLEEVRESYSATDIQQKIVHLEKLLSITPPGTERYIKCLGHLEDWYKSKFRRSDDISDIEEAIKYSRLVLDANYASDRRYDCLGSLRNLLHYAFDKTREISYLEESITISYDILECKFPQRYHCDATQRLVPSLLARSWLLGRIEDRHEAIRLISVVIDNEYGRESNRFKLACKWAIIARGIRHPTTLAAYKTAMALMERSLSFAPTVSTQHTRLVAMSGDCQTMPLDYASYQIHLRRFEEAVETLEQGRALLWSEMRGLRTPVFQLIGEDSPLAKKFAEINQELEASTVAVTPSGRPEVEDSIHQSKDGTDAFGRLVTKQKKLVKERDALISQIRSRPGLEGFLRAPSFYSLRSAASRGPVIIVNHSSYRSDIVIIFHDYLPCSIPTDETFFARANELRDELVEARKKGLDSQEYQDALCLALKGLYKLVGEPVIKRLLVLGVPEQSRIWWCPTSVFCSLPLHAMGPIPSSNPGMPRYFSDLYIPSYTPSLSALIDSRKASPQTLEKPSLLLVAQPNDSLPGVTGEIKVILERAIKARIRVTGRVSDKATPSTVLEGLRGSQLAHFACHGVLETGKPFEASFKLHGGERLTLLEIVQSRLPGAEFAFLSCCHAAEITADSVSDEALHLTAAMQYCGFRSVVGTMWAMADTDGLDLAKNFYKSLFSRRDSSVPYYERSAEALRDATQKLRGKRGISLERWVNFVHYGA